MLSCSTRRGELTVRANVHLLLHAVVPALVAFCFYRDKFWRTWLILVGTMVVDVDHLLADPVYDPNRCSLSAHPLHSPPAIAAYAAATVWPTSRLVGIGLLIHMSLDGIDCAWMSLEK